VGPSRLLVRDCHPDDLTVKEWKALDTDLLYTEYKSENGINRITSAANPRFIERVVTGSRFDVEIVYSAFQIKENENWVTEANKDLENLRLAILMLEHNFLGKSGSRGYGRVKFGFTNPVWMSQGEYKSPSGQFASLKLPMPDFEQLHSTIDIDWKISSNSTN
jgi:CRISPR-associated protein Csm3